MGKEGFQLSSRDVHRTKNKSVLPNAMGNSNVEKNEKNCTSEDKGHSFNKKSYRLKKYSKKYKLDQWEKQRRQKLLRNYYKEVSGDPLSGKFTRKDADKLETVENSTEADGSVPGQFVLLPEKLAERRNKNSVKNDASDKRQTGKRSQKFDAYMLAKQEYRRIQDDKKNEREVKQKAVEERKLALEEYRNKKAERFKKLSQKTKKGQPVMKGRLELLYEKIQKTI